MELAKEVRQALKDAGIKCTVSLSKRQTPVLTVKVKTDESDFVSVDEFTFELKNDNSIITEMGYIESESYPYVFDIKNLDKLSKNEKDLIAEYCAKQRYEKCRKGNVKFQESKTTKAIMTREGLEKFRKVKSIIESFHESDDIIKYISSRFYYYIIIS